LLPSVGAEPKGPGAILLDELMYLGPWEGPPKKGEELRVAKNLVILHLLMALSSTHLFGGEVLEFLRGTAPQDGIVLLPIGYHPQHRFHLVDNQLIGLVYHSMAAGTFINSYGDRSGYLVWVRDLYSSSHFGIEYFAGAVVGYNGRLAKTGGIPYKNSILWKHDVNPVVSFNVYYSFSKHVRAQIMVSPLVYSGGLKYSF
jgi:hypothetical protein